jgi:hypothetical protein
MRITALILGIIGGLAGLVAALLAVTVGGIGSAVGAQDAGMVGGLGIFALVLAIVGLAGAGLALSKPRLSAGLLLASGLLGFLAVSLFWLFAGLLLIPASAFAFFGRAKGAPVAQDPSHPSS